jgi:hypothetical protein
VGLTPEDNELRKRLQISNLLVMGLRDIFETDEPLSVAELVRYGVQWATEPRIRPLIKQALALNKTKGRVPSGPPYDPEDSAAKENPNG